LKAENKQARTKFVEKTTIEQ